MSAFQAEYEGSIPLLGSRYRCSSGVEQQIHILWVIGSNPINGTDIIKFNILWKIQGQNDVLKKYLWNEWRYNVHKRYWKYFDEWYSNLLEPQKEFYRSWIDGHMSPYHWNIIGVWCNGSIPVSKTVGESSSLSTPAWILRYGVMVSTLDFDSGSRSSNLLISTKCRVGRAVRSWSAKPVRVVQLHYPTLNALVV